MMFTRQQKRLIFKDLFPDRVKFEDKKEQLIEVTVYYGVELINMLY